MRLGILRPGERKTDMKKRIAAEWEPAVGVMVAWPPAVPRALFEEFAKDTTLHVLVADEAAKNDAMAAFKRWGTINPDEVKFLVVPQGEDYCWPRDWGPQPLFEEDGTFKMLGPTYVYSTPFCDIGHDVPLLCAADEPLPLSEFEGDGQDNLAAEAIASQLGLGFVKVPFAFTGGNVLTDGVNTLFSTEVLLFENRFMGTDDKAYFDEVAKVTGMTNYNVLSDYEMFSLNHVDCLAKPLDDRRILVLRYPEDHPHHQLVEDIVEKEIGSALNSYGQPWEVVRVDTNYIHREGQLAAYANSVILNKNIYVPQYSIPQDKVALEQWREAMPGYTVKGFEYKLDDEPESLNLRGIYEYVGWDSGDVLHCRARAVWDPQMLYVRAARPFGPVAAGEPFTVDAAIHAYSNKPLTGAPELVWRVGGAEEWQRVAMEPTATHEVWAADLPGFEAGTTVEYYVEAADESGRRECSPRVAPEGFYSYTVQA